MKIPQNDYKADDFFVVPQDQYIGYMTRFIDLGTHEEKFTNGDVKKLRKLHLGFELPDLKKDFGRGKEEPAYISEEMTLSSGENSNLRKMILAWVGTDIAKDPTFQVEDLLGVPAQISVGHNTSKKNGKTYANIISIVKPMKSIPLPEPVNAKKVLSLEPSEFSQEIFDGLPKKLKEKIMESPEWLRLQEK